jgi:hypothetical protein
MIALSLVLLLHTQTPAPSADATQAKPEQKARALVLDLNPVSTSADDARLLSGVVSALVAENEQLEVLTSSDVRRMTELEASKQQMGCDESSCLAEIAGALDARYVFFGDVGRLGADYVVNISLFDSEKTSAVGRVSVKVPKLDEGRARLRQPLSELLAPFGGLPPDDSTSPLVVAGGITAVSGASLAIGLGLAALVFDGIAGNPTNPAKDKTDALVFGLACLAGSAVGVLGALTGGGLIALGATEGT